MRESLRKILEVHQGGNGCMAELEFEKPVVELRNKIRELKDYTKNSQMDFSEEIRILEEKLENLEEDIYGNLKVWGSVQIARHAERPTTLDYIEHLFTDFLNVMEIVYLAMIAAIVGGIAKYKGMPVTVIGHQRGKIRKKIFAVTLECLIQKDIEKHCVS